MKTLAAGVLDFLQTIGTQQASMVELLQIRL
jgi:hypothetical protein